MVDAAPPPPTPPGQCLAPAETARLVVLRAGGSPLTAVVSPMGGELVGLQFARASHAVELLHRGMNFCPVEGFAGRAPMLWPATGRTYLAGSPHAATPGWTWQGRPYAMPLHGFARDLQWRLAAKGRDTAVFELKDTAETRALYPFRFRLTAAYRLSGRTLTIGYRVAAGANDAPMPFSIGNHVTFALPLGGHGAAAETRVSTAARWRRALDAAGRPAGRLPQTPLSGVRVGTLGRQVALPLSGYGRGAAVATLVQPGWGRIVISQRASLPASGDPVRFNLWGDAAAGYFAVEPWLGMQNGLTSGEGLVRLAPGRTFAWTVTLRIDTERMES